jgi:hypothetical protein
VDIGKESMMETTVGTEVDIFGVVVVVFGGEFNEKAV